MSVKSNQIEKIIYFYDLLYMWDQYLISNIDVISISTSHNEYIPSVISVINSHFEAEWLEISTLHLQFGNHKLESEI